MLLKLKTKEKQEKKKLWLQKQTRLIVIRFIDPYQSYNLYGDMILPNKFWHNRNEMVYPAELFLDYKALRQIYVRPNGIILEFEDFNENHLTPIPFLRERLRSLGNKEAYILSDFLNMYAEYFENSNIPEFWSLFQEKNSNLKKEMFDWVDELFEKNKENLVAIRGNKIISKKDFRAKILCFNSKLLEWISPEKNVFSETFIRDCCRLIFFRDLEEFTNLIKNFLIKGFVSEINDQRLLLPLNTKIGIVYTSVRNYAMYFKENQMYLQYWIHNKQDFEQNIIEKFKKKAILEEKIEKKRVTIEQNEATAYSNLMKTYYCQK